MTKEERLALIKQVAEKRKRQQSFKNKLATQGSKVRRWTDVEEKPRRKKIDQNIDKLIDKLDENHNLWTDAEKYADTYYGDTYRSTTRYDNDWD